MFLFWFLISKPHSESLPVTKPSLFNIKQKNNIPYKSPTVKDRRGIKVVSQVLNWESKSALKYILNESTKISTTKIKTKVSPS